VEKGGGGSVVLGTFVRLAKRGRGGWGWGWRMGARGIALRYPQE